MLYKIIDDVSHIENLISGHLTDRSVFQMFKFENRFENMAPGALNVYVFSNWPIIEAFIGHDDCLSIHSQY